MKPMINKKYVSLLEEAFKKYRDVDIVQRSPTTTSKSVVTENKIISDIPTTSFLEEERVLKVKGKRDKTDKLKHMKKVATKATLSKKRAAQLKCVKFSKEEDEYLLNMIEEENTSGQKSLNYKELGRKLNRRDSSIFLRMQKLRSGKVSYERRPFSLLEDQAVIDSAVESLKTVGRLRTTSLSDKAKLAASLNRLTSSVTYR